MGKKEKESKAASKARKAAKQEQKAAKTEKKATKKSKATAADEDSDADDVDLDTVLAEYARQQEQFLKITETPCEAPAARSSATLLASPSSANELLLFGGEAYDGSLARFFNNLFIYNIRYDTWKLVTSPNSPLPRSGHAWTRAGNVNAIYLFGGEFSSPKQGTFYHYNDLWHLDPATREWSKMESKGKGSSPPARSGHRMTFFKHYVVLFGGFQDTAQQTKYLNDLWLFDTRSFVWHNPALPPASMRPDARSSFSLLPHDSGAVLYGGYSRVKAVVGGSKQQGKGARPAMRNVLTPKVHEDTWFLRITPPPEDKAAATTPPSVRWERRKRPANAPAPARVGTQMVHHRGRGLLFGGVHDVEQSEEGIDSEFFNDLFAWNVDRNRFFRLTLRRPRKTNAPAANAERGKRQRGKADEKELLANLAALEAKSGGGGTAEVGMKEASDSDEEDDASANPRAEKTVVFEMPHPRFNAALAVQDDVLYLFGGRFERGDTEIDFDEMWCLDLDKLDGCTCLFQREVAALTAAMDEEEESDDEEGSDMDEEEEMDLDTPATPADEALLSPTIVDSTTEVDEKADIEEKADPSALSDDLPHPRPFESLREFFARTSQAWQELVLQSIDGKGSAATQSVKELRKAAFDRADQTFWDCREEVRALEIEQEDAGIGEVVNAMDRAGVNEKRR